MPKDDLPPLGRLLSLLTSSTRLENVATEQLVALVRSFGSQRYSPPNDTMAKLLHVVKQRIPDLAAKDVVPLLSAFAHLVFVVPPLRDWHDKSAVVAAPSWYFQLRDIACESLKKLSAEPPTTVNLREFYATMELVQYIKLYSSVAQRQSDTEEEADLEATASAQMQSATSWLADRYRDAVIRDAAALMRDIQTPCSPTAEPAAVDNLPFWLPALNQKISAFLLVLPPPQLVDLLSAFRGCKAVGWSDPLMERPLTLLIMQLMDVSTLRTLSTHHASSTLSVLKQLCDDMSSSLASPPPHRPPKRLYNLFRACNNLIVLAMASHQPQLWTNLKYTDHKDFAYYQQDAMPDDNDWVEAVVHLVYDVLALLDDYELNHCGMIAAELASDMCERVNEITASWLRRIREGAGQIKGRQACIEICWELANCRTLRSSGCSDALKHELMRHTQQHMTQLCSMRKALDNKEVEAVKAAGDDDDGSEFARLIVACAELGFKPDASWMEAAVGSYAAVMERTCDDDLEVIAKAMAKLSQKEDAANSSSGAVTATISSSKPRPRRNTMTQPATSTTSTTTKASPSASLPDHLPTTTTPATPAKAATPATTKSTIITPTPTTKLSISFRPPLTASLRAEALSSLTPEMTNNDSLHRTADSLVGRVWASDFDELFCNSWYRDPSTGVLTSWDMMDVGSVVARVFKGDYGNGDFKYYSDTRVLSAVIWRVASEWADQWGPQRPVVTSRDATCDESSSDAGTTTGESSSSWRDAVLPGKQEWLTVWMEAMTKKVGTADGDDLAAAMWSLVQLGAGLPRQPLMALLTRVSEEVERLRGEVSHAVVLWGMSQLQWRLGMEMMAEALPQVSRLDPRSALLPWSVAKVRQSLGSAAGPVATDHSLADKVSASVLSRDLTRHHSGAGMTHMLLSLSLPGMHQQHRAAGTVLELLHDNDRSDQYWRGTDVSPIISLLYVLAIDKARNSTTNKAGSINISGNHRGKDLMMLMGSFDSEDCPIEAALERLVEGWEAQDLNSELRVDDVVRLVWSVEVLEVHVPQALAQLVRDWSSSHVSLLPPRSLVSLVRSLLLWAVPLRQAGRLDQLLTQARHRINDYTATAAAADGSDVELMREMSHAMSQLELALKTGGGKEAKVVGGDDKSQRKVTAAAGRDDESNILPLTLNTSRVQASSDQVAPLRG